MTEFDHIVQLIWAGITHMFVTDEKGNVHNGAQIMHALLRNGAKLAVGFGMTETEFLNQAKHHHAHMTKAHEAFLEHGAEQPKPRIQIVKG